MTIFLTGATGFVGRHVLNDLLSKGFNVVALCRENNADLVKSEKITWIKGSLGSVSEEDLKGSDVIIHIAAAGVIPGQNDFDEIYKTNFTDFVSLLKKAKNASIKRVVVAGTCSEYGSESEKYENVPIEASLNPIDSYGASKAAATIAAKAFAVEYGLELIILRLFHVYGEGESENRFWPSLKASALSGKDFHMTSGEQIRDFTPVQFVSKCFLHFAIIEKVKNRKPVILNIGTGKSKSLYEFALEEWKKFNGKGKIYRGTVKYRKNEVMRYVPKVDNKIISLFSNRDEISDK